MADRGEVGMVQEYLIYSLEGQGDLVGEPE